MPQALVRILMLPLVTIFAAVLLACSGSSEDEATASATPTTSAEATIEATAESAAPNEELVVRLDAWDATLTIPAGALPEGVTADKVSAAPTQQLEPDPDSLQVLAAFEFGPDGIELTEPATLEFTVPLEPDRALIAAVLDDGELRPLGISDEGDGSFTIERLDDTSVRVTVAVPHFSTWWFYEGQPAVKFDQFPLAPSYLVGDRIEARVDVTLLDHQVRVGGGGDNPVTPLIVAIGGEMIDWEILGNGRWKLIGAAEVFLFQQPLDQRLTARARRATLTFVAECARVGSFAIGVTPEVIVEHGSVSMFFRPPGETELRPLDLGTAMLPKFTTYPTGAGLFWESECVAPAPSVTATPVTSPPTQTATPVTSPPTATVTPVTSPPTSTVTPPAPPSPTVTVPPPSAVDELLKKIEDDLGFNGSFSNGDCARYPASYDLGMTIDFALPNNLVLKQAQHTNTGTVDLVTGAAVLTEPGIERYDIVLTAAGGTLRFTGQYFFNDGSGECQWAVSGTQK